MSHIFISYYRKDLNHTMTSVAFSPDGKYVVSGSVDNTARVWEALTGMEVTNMVHNDDVQSVAFSTDGKYVVSGSTDHTARVWEVSTSREVARMIHEDFVYVVAFSADGSYIISEVGIILPVCGYGDPRI